MDPNNFWCLQDNRDSFILVITLISLWSLPWKAFALWNSAKKNQKIWFLIFMIVNTVGLLEIFYLLILPRFKNLKNEKQK